MKVLAAARRHDQQGLALTLHLEGGPNAADSAGLVVALDDFAVDDGVGERLARATPLHQQHQLVLLVEPLDSARRVPHGSKVDAAMRLRAGFAYWPDGYQPAPFHPEVLATVAVLLQRAREHDKLPDDKRLSTASYRQVVLDPENFARFNDGVLQGALLRCAQPSELDYRADHAASDFMKALILRALGRATEEAGEATLEFLLALMTKRLQLEESHWDEVIAAALAGEGRPTKLQAAIRFLLRTATEPQRAKRRLPF